MSHHAAPRPWVLLLSILVLSIPFLVLGSLSSARLLPGLPLSALMFLCTAAVALWAAWRTRGLAGIGALLGRVFDARRARPWTWHLVSALVFPAVLLAEYAIMRAAHMPLPAPQVAWLQAPLLFVVLFLAAACEEVAWSATLLEPLQTRYGALGAGLLLGAFAAVWHIIPFAQANSSVSWVIGQCVFTVGFRVVVAWIYDVSGHSLFDAVVCHACYNLAWQLFPNQGSGYNPWITAGLTWVVVVVVVAVFGARTLAGRRAISATT
jgi:uncharacterized protein